MCELSLSQAAASAVIIPNKEMQLVKKALNSNMSQLPENAQSMR